MISKTEASESLKAMEQVHIRTVKARSYNQASVHLMLTGVVWAIGYTLTGLTPPAQWPYVWLPLAALQVIGSFVLTHRAARPVSGNPAAQTVQAARGLWMGAALLVFIISTYLLFHPQSMIPYLAFPALVVALVYSFIGAQGMTRYLWIGFGIFALTCTGLLLTPDAIAFWIAAAGGGGLFLGGLWMRKV